VAAGAWKNPQFVDTVLHYYRTRWGGALSLRAYATLQAHLDTKPTPAITVPTIFAAGSADACDLPQASEEQTSCFKAGYQRVLISGAGHFPHRETPSAVAKLLISQLASID
jgi:pimeloyl-ACP methyl ester carboxylesterase